MITKRLPTLFYTLMALLTVTAGGLLTTVASAQIPTLPQSPIPADIEQAINSVMAVSYSSEYSKVRGCTLYHHKGVSSDDGERYVSENNYCIAPIKYQIEDINGETHLYLLASGYVYNGNTSRADPSIGGLFELYKLGNSWVMSAGDPFIFTGGAGRSQLYKFGLSQVGEDKYAWTGKHCGSGAGGQSSCLWTMYAPINGSIKKVAEIDVDYFYELSSAGMYYEGTGYVRHDDNAAMTDGFYPLNITIDKKSGRIGSRYDDKDKQPSSEEKSTYRYNSAKQQFELVE